MGMDGTAGDPVNLGHLPAQPWGYKTAKLDEEKNVHDQKFITIVILQKCVLWKLGIVSTAC